MLDIHSDDVSNATGKRPKQDDSPAVHDQKIESLMSMGFSFETVVKALKESDNNVHTAVDSLFSHQRVGEANTTAYNKLPKPPPSDSGPAREIEVKDGNPETRKKDRRQSISNILNPQTSPSKPEDGGDKIEQKPRRLKRLFSALSRHRTSSISKASADSTFTSSTLSFQDHTSKPGSLASRVKEYERVVRSISARTLRRKCGSCDKFLLSDETLVKAFTQYLLEQNGKVEGIFCQNCNVLCISGGVDQAMMVLSLLCHFDINSRHNITTNNDTPVRRWSLRSRPSRFKSRPDGIGYGGIRTERSPNRKEQRGLSQKFLADKDDNMTFRILTALTTLLPGTGQRESCSVEPQEVHALLHYSSLLDRIATMLRNNDLGDISCQAKLYTALVDFLQKLVENPSTSSLILESRIVRKPELSLLELVLGNKEKRSGIIELDTLQPFSQHIACLADQCKTILASNSCDEEDKRIYQRLVQLNDLLTVNDNCKDKVDSQNNDAWQRALRVIDVPDECISIDLQILDMVSPPTARPTGQIKRIMQEIARLQASLPDGIFVRYASSRPDKMKVLIIGPRDTPYENGLFEFDLYCDSSFPSLPPKMLLRTTGGGKVRFNPNLYNTGMVCLSLLGTWAGEPWTAKSTLLQILVSIQAMVFCEKPWYNEPGREMSRNESLSDKYNTSLWPHVVQHAMLDWLGKVVPTATNPTTTSTTTNTSEPGIIAKANNSIWDEVIRKHFSTNGSQTIKTITKWTLQLGNKVATPPSKRRRSNADPNLSEENALNQDLAEYLRTALPTLRRAPALTAC